VPKMKSTLADVKLVDSIIIFINRW